ncbi:uncharacterized protein LOC122075678 isoform X2 [Macadamia integrifolia]|uniref:uncharacterized protein LOC122075678 isoform X2 n=1 Tax=Macadamia integrifolia TaxID=60698 RepID=UPI001C4E9B0F|nr:uncharacterized protein LOC122075678 isoform X2 [Macadamia integrifolia]
MLGTKKRQTRRRKKKALSFFPEVGNEEKKDEKERLETKKKERFKLIGLMIDLLVRFMQPQGVNSALERAFDNYINDSESWQQLVQKNMKTDFSWDLSASQYDLLWNIPNAKE